MIFYYVKGCGPQFSNLELLSVILDLLLSLVVLFAHLQVMTCFSELGSENKNKDIHVPYCKYAAVHLILTLWAQT